MNIALLGLIIVLLQTAICDLIDIPQSDLKEKLEILQAANSPLEIIIAINATALTNDEPLAAISDGIIHHLKDDGVTNVKRGQLELDTLMMFSILVSTIDEGLAAIETLSSYDEVSAIDVNSFYTDFDHIDDQ